MGGCALIAVVKSSTAASVSLPVPSILLSRFIAKRLPLSYFRIDTVDALDVDTYRPDLRRYRLVHVKSVNGVNLGVYSGPCGTAIVPLVHKEAPPTLNEYGKNGPLFSILSVYTESLAETCHGREVCTIMPFWREFKTEERRLVRLFFKAVRNGRFGKAGTIAVGPASVTVYLVEGDYVDFAVVEYKPGVETAYNVYAMLGSRGLLKALIASSAESFEDLAYQLTMMYM